MANSYGIPKDAELHELPDLRVTYGWPAMAMIGSIADER